MISGPSRPPGQRLVPLLQTAGAAVGSGLAFGLHAAGLHPALSVGSLILTLGASAWAAHGVVARRLDALEQIRSGLEQLARGHTAARLDPLRFGELADAAAAVNRVTDAIAAARDRSARLSRGLTELPEQLANALADVRRAADNQEAGVEEAAALQAHLNASIRSINEEVEKLARSNEESASSSLQLGSSVDQVAQSAAALQGTIESSTRSLHQVGESIRTVAESSDSVQQVAGETAASMTQMDRSIQEVGLHVRGASELTERVAQSADRGSQAVGATIEGIAEIREVTLGARRAIEGLAERIGEIGEIATVIGAITDETNLLSLNAAIIAAQAGEHGKAFAVVADQVKELARRTSQSTREIEALIGAVQHQSGRAVQAMAAGIEAVEKGVERSRLAGDALEQIRDSAADASMRVSEIARAAEEQARNSKQVAEAARRTSEHVQEISQALTEQSDATEQLLGNSTASVEMCRQMTLATEEQRTSGRYITGNIESITDMIRSIQAATRGHESASTAVAETFERLLENARSGASRLPELAATVAELREHGEAVSRELQRFGDEAGPDRPEPPGR